jgi:peptidoglycan/LPS O-acetylase OafA/YrhL
VAVPALRLERTTFAGMTTVFAICEGHDPSVPVVVGVVLALALLAGIVLALLWSARGEREGAALVFVVAVVLGAVIATTPGGLTADNADYLARFFEGLAAGALLGALVGVVRKRRRGAYIALGFLGGGALITVLVLLLVLSLAGLGGCID